MDDDALIHRISALVDEEHQLERQIAAEEAGPNSDARLKELEVALDQCWDLLRQRRARRNAGENPDEAKVRDENVVERYQQ
jgi:hypothetical protein